MKALWFTPFTFAAGAEGFALFAPYLVATLAVLHLARTARRQQPRVPATAIRRPSRPALDIMPDAQPAL